MKIKSEHWASHSAFERIEGRIGERLRDYDDPKAIREFLRDLKGTAEYHKKEIERMYSDFSEELKYDH